MLLREFPGADKFIENVDAAVCAPSAHELADRLRDTLCRMIREQTVTLPPCVYEVQPDHYGRRELYRSEKFGYSVIAMTWGPNQGTMLHDHSGMWCVEGVWHGALQIDQYDLAEKTDERFRFIKVGSIRAGTGSAGSLIPPYEYHTIRNPAPDSTAVSVHIYSGHMTCCSVFRPVDANWYARDSRQLSLD